MWRRSHGVLMFTDNGVCVFKNNRDSVMKWRVIIFDVVDNDTYYDENNSKKKKKQNKTKNKNKNKNKTTKKTLNKIVNIVIIQFRNEDKEQ